MNIANTIFSVLKPVHKMSIGTSASDLQCFRRIYTRYVRLPSSRLDDRCWKICDHN